MEGKNISQDTHLLSAGLDIQKKRHFGSTIHMPGETKTSLGIYNLTYGGCGEAVNTADCGSVIRGFESLQSPQQKTPVIFRNGKLRYCLAVLRKVQTATTCDGRNDRAYRKMGQSIALTTTKSTHAAESSHKVHRE